MAEGRYKMPLLRFFSKPQVSLKDGKDEGGGTGTSPPKRQTSRTIHKDFHLVLIGSFCLCFNAGFLNVVTLSSYLGTATAHVTGLVARASMFIGTGAWDKLYLPVTTWVAFLIGAFMAGLMISYQSFYLGRGYGRALLLIAAIQSVALLIGVLREEESHQYIYAAACACGLQNGLTTKYSGNVVRTTHMTGATTDLGVVLGHVCRGKLEELWKVQLHITALVGFLCGGILGIRAYLVWAEMSMLINVILSALLGFSHICYLSYHEHISLYNVARCTKDIKIHRCEQGGYSGSCRSLDLHPDGRNQTMGIPSIPSNQSFGSFQSPPLAAVRAFQGRDTLGLRPGLHSTHVRQAETEGHMEPLSESEEEYQLAQSGDDFEYYEDDDVAAQPSMAVGEGGDAESWGGTRGGGLLPSRDSSPVFGAVVTAGGSSLTGVELVSRTVRDSSGQQHVSNAPTGTAASDREEGLGSVRILELDVA